MLKFLFFNISFFLLSAHAAQIAIVKSPKAIVYADTSLQSPIGFVRQGKKLRVGRVARKSGTLVPIIVSGRIAYIRLIDIEEERPELEGENSGRRKLREHEIENQLEETTVLERFKGDSFLILSVHTLPLGTSWDTIAQAAGYDTGGVAKGISFAFEHRPEKLKYSFNTSFSYYTKEQEELYFKLPVIEFNGFWSPFKFGLISAEAFLGTAISFDARARTDNDLTESRGGMFGYQFGAQVRLLPTSKFGAVAGLSFKKWNIESLETIEVYQDPVAANNNNVDFYNFSSISSVNLFFGVSYKF